jgi:site-specific DNA-cytosine methylase
MYPKAKQFKDVRDVSIDVLENQGLLPIDIISGGFPCQDLSAAGRGEGIEGARSGLWREMFRIIRQVRPAWLVIENVPAIRLRGVDRVIAPLERIGHTCWPLVVGAWAIGAPHKRDRSWIVANSGRNGCEDGNQSRASGKDCSRKNIAQRKTQRHQRRIIESQRLRSSMADPEQDGRGQGGGKSENKSGQECGRCESSGGVQLANANEAGRKVHPRLGCDDGTQLASIIGSRWPSRPGESQHEWEAPRLVEFAVGDATDGLARRVRSRTNKALLRMAGNGWCYPLPLLIYRWIVEMNERMNNENLQNAIGS